jgi:hypothetical protein
LAGLSSGNGNRARSSLAAAAGGGVTAESGRVEVESSEALKKRQSPVGDKAGKQEADMRPARFRASRIPVPLKHWQASRFFSAPECLVERGDLIGT